MSEPRSWGETERIVEKAKQEVSTYVSVAKEEILAKVKESAESGSSSGGVQTFTENGTFTVPAGVTKIWVTAAAGGQAGGGGSRNNGRSGVGGAGGDCILKKAFNVTQGQSISIVVGEGGTPNGGVGGATVIGNLITLAGGDNSRTNTNGGGKGGLNGSWSSSTTRDATDGKPGLLGLGGVLLYSDVPKYSGGGGGGSLGDGGLPGNISDDNYGQAGNPGTYGGGGGGSTNFNTNPNGGKGGDGIVIIEW